MCAHLLLSDLVGGTCQLESNTSPSNTELMDCWVRELKNKPEWLRQEHPFTHHLSFSLSVCETARDLGLSYACLCGFVQKINKPHTIQYGRAWHRCITSCALAYVLIVHTDRCLSLLYSWSNEVKKHMFEKKKLQYIAPCQNKLSSLLLLSVLNWNMDIIATRVHDVTFDVVEFWLQCRVCFVFHQRNTSCFHHYFTHLSLEYVIIIVFVCTLPCLRVIKWWS